MGEGCRKGSGLEGGTCGDWGEGFSPQWVKKVDGGGERISEGRQRERQVVGEHSGGGKNYG